MAFARHRIEGESELNAKKWSRIVISSADDFYGAAAASQSSLPLLRVSLDLEL